MYFFKEAFRNITKNSLMSVASVSVLVACLVIVGCFFLISENININLSELDQNNEIVAFIDDTYTDEQNEKVGEEIKALSNIADVIFVSKEQAFEEYKKEFQENEELLNGLDENPLRNGYRIILKDTGKAAETISAVKAISGVANVRARQDIMEKLHVIRNTVAGATLWMAVLLFAIAIFIVSNTIKLGMFSRREEINIMKFVGATDGFIRLPFVIEGVILGTFGAIISLFLVWLIYQNTFGEISNTLGIIRLIKFSDELPRLVTIFLSTGASLGIITSTFTIRKYLNV